MALAKRVREAFAQHGLLLASFEYEAVEDTPPHTRHSGKVSVR
jgi:hypothetical protein